MTTKARMSASANHPKEKIVVVDDNDKVIGSMPRERVDSEGLRYRVSALWVKNSKGENLMARRAYTKTHDPGKWGPAVAGTNTEGESYLDNIKKEAKEELGVRRASFELGPHVKRDGKYNYFTQWFIATIDKQASGFRIQKDEVAEVRWFSDEGLRKEIRSNPNEFLNGIEEILDLFSRA